MALTADPVRSAGAAIRPLSRSDWSRLAPSMCGYGYRQQWSYCALSAGKEWRTLSEPVAISREGGDPLALAAVRTATLPLGVGGVAYISGGPLLAPGVTDPEDLTLVLRALVDRFVERRRLVLRIAPPVEWVLAGHPVADVLAAAGLRPAESPRPYRTLVVDLDATAEAIAGRLHQKWRNQLRRAQRQDLTVERGSGARLFAEFDALHRELMARKGFGVELDTSFYAQVNREAAGRDRFDVTIARHDGAAVAGHVGSALGETSVYLLGASNAVGNRLGASYLLQWAAIERARELGMHWYDLGGIDPEGNPGVHHFKRRMGGFEVVVPGPFERSPRGARASATRLGERAYRALRRPHTR